MVTVGGDRIRFAHPLLAAAAYQSTVETERREVHRRLAQTVDELEERARHLALAADGPDAKVARVLERAAEHARARGASAAAAELCEDARRLTPSDRPDDAWYMGGRAREEMTRISGRASSGDELTPTERRIVDLVAQGRTNQEVAAVLFVSPRTVEFHLRNVFRKLDVRSRAELVRRFVTPVS